MKTHTEIIELKRQWENDPCWDIETTEGFEDHKQELLEHRVMKEYEWKLKEEERLEPKARKMGCSIQMIKWMETIEKKIQKIDDDLSMLNEYLEQIESKQNKKISAINSALYELDSRR